MNYLSANKTKITGALLVAFGVLQTQSETIRDLLTPEKYALFTIIIGVAVAVLGFLNSGGSITPPGEQASKGKNLPSLLLALLFVPLLASSLPGCVGTRDAFKTAAASADPAVETAFVLKEQYAATLSEAAAIAANTGTPPAAKAVIKAAELKATPVVLGLTGLRSAYLGAKTAENAEALQAAVNDAILKVSALLHAIKSAKGTP